MTRRGTVTGTTVEVRGPFALGNLDQLDVTRNEATGTGRLEGDTLVLEGHGVLEGTVRSWDFRCTGESIAVFTPMESTAALDDEVPVFTMRGLEPVAGSFGRFTILGP